MARQEMINEAQKKEMATKMIEQKASSDTKVNKLKEAAEDLINQSDVEAKKKAAEKKNAAADKAKQLAAM